MGRLLQLLNRQRDPPGYVDAKDQADRQTHNPQNHQPADGSGLLVPQTSDQGFPPGVSVLLKAVQLHLRLFDDQNIVLLHIIGRLGVPVLGGQGQHVLPHGLQFRESGVQTVHNLLVA